MKWDKICVLLDNFMAQAFSISEDFNTRILSPELSQGDLVELHNMAKDLYRNYCAKDAVDRIKFDEDIVSELAEGKTEDLVSELAEGKIEEFVSELAEGKIEDIVVNKQRLRLRILLAN